MLGFLIKYLQTAYLENNFQAMRWLHQAACVNSCKAQRQINVPILP
jgi:hypothetical protein